MPGTCKYCKKPLRAFSVNQDWKTRQYHKKCWKEMPCFISDAEREKLKREAMRNTDLSNLDI